jgi:hypothetical protein
MNPRELIVLSPYQIPGQNPLMLGTEDVAAFLQGYSALWHPAVLGAAAGPPRIGSPYDYEQPKAGQFFAVPETPPLLLPDDWDQRVWEAGAAAFRATADRATTLENLAETLQTLPPLDPPDPLARRPLRDWPADRVGPFLGIGFGFLHVNALFEAMQHENLLAANELWQEVREALAALDHPDPEAYRRHLQAAADRLLSARQVLYPVTIHVLDIHLLDAQNLVTSFPAAFDKGMALNVVASAALLEKLGKDQADRLTALRDRVATDQVEVCGGSYVEREDALLPLESQLWNLLKGLTVSRDLLGSEVRVFARKRFGFHPQLPMLLTSVGLQRALLLAFDDAGLPSFSATVVNWPSPDGKQVEGFTRTPFPADNPNTYFHATHYLHKTIMQDHAATLALLHSSAPAAPWYEDWLELSRFAPVLGQWTTFTRYFNEVLAGEYAPVSSADEFHADYLSERTGVQLKHPISGFARQVRQRRGIDTLFTLASLHRGLTGSNDQLRLDDRLTQLETQVEIAAGGLAMENPAEKQEAIEAALEEVQKEVTDALAERLLARAQGTDPGYLALNPCSFPRRVALELDGAGHPLPITGPVKACQIDGAKLRVVIEVPALGFAWFPRSGPEGTAAMARRMRLADDRHVRNEFFEAEIDPATGGLRGLWDQRTRISRLGQQLVFNPGSTMRAKEVKATSIGPALGEVISEGALLDDQQEVLATFRQRFRAWLGRPVLDLRIEIYPQRPAEGYAWHAYYGARFAWRDERALLLRGVNGSGSITSHTRPQTPDYLEIRQNRQNTVIFPGGRPFHQRHGSRMLDVLLMPPGETVQVFDLALGLDRENPMLTALGMVTPLPYVPVAKGPPHIGASGWLFHLDCPNLLLTSIRPAPGGADAVTARLLECGFQSCQAELRCVRDPRRAVLLDARGESLRETDVQGDSALFEVSMNDLVQLRVEFS